MMLGDLIRGWRFANNIGVRAAAKVIGISSATLSRIENGNQCDSGTLTKILVWLLEA